MADASEGLTRGDAHIANHAIEEKKQLIVVFNKADLVDTETVNYRRFPFLSRQPMIFISAKDHQFIDQLLELIQERLSIAGEIQNQDSSPDTLPTTPDL